MNIPLVNDYGSLIFDWTDLIVAVIPIMCTTLLVTWALKLGIPFVVQVISTLSAAVIIGIMWNNAHPQMHNVRVHLPISEGPPNLTIPYPNIYYKNHEAHHLIKGHAKGNYNVVFLGADEIFKSNKMG